MAYAANPDKRGLDLLMRAWGEAGPPGGRLGIGGLDRAEGERWLRRLGAHEPPGVRVARIAGARALADAWWRAPACS